MQECISRGELGTGRCILRGALLLALAGAVTSLLGIGGKLGTRLGLIFAASVTGVVLVMPAAMRMARRLGAVDHPGGRRIHEQPTPRLGGVAVWVGFLGGLAAISMHHMPNIRALVGCSTVIFLVGLLDDIRGVKASVKLLVQVSACCILILDGVHVTFLPPTWWGVAGEWAITVVWIVGITNALNFLDGMDGLLALLVVETGLIYFVLSLLLGASMLSYCSVALVGACLGFLGFNIKPARVFLGDGGSTFLGFFLATMSIQGEWARRDPLVSFFIPVLILSVPIYDMVFTTVARIASGRVRTFRQWVDYTGRDHLHHRLEGLGLTRPQVVLSIAFLNMAVGLGAITLFEARTYGGVALVGQAVCIYLVIALLEVLGGRQRRRMRDGGREPEREDPSSEAR